MNNPTSRQHVECQTCHEVFLDIDAWEYIKVARSYANRGKTLNINWQDISNELIQQNYNGIIDKANSVAFAAKGFFDRFFCKAVLHWCDNPSHIIIASVPLGNNGLMQRYDLTNDLKAAVELFGPRYIDAQRRLMEIAFDEGAII